MKGKDETRKADPAELQRNSKMATIIGTCFIITLISMVYAFVQQVAAERNAERAFVNEALAKDSKQKADQHAEEAKRQAAIAQELKNQMDECLRLRK